MLDRWLILWILQQHGLRNLTRDDNSLAMSAGLNVPELLANDLCNFFIQAEIISSSNSKSTVFSENWECKLFFNLSVFVWAQQQKQLGSLIDQNLSTYVSLYPEPREC